MKKLFLCMVFTVSFGIAHAQIDSLSKLKTENGIHLTGKNELNINLIGFALGMPEIAYEHIFNQKKGIGLSAFISPEKNNDYNFGFIPYFRWYLGKPNWLMIFIEGNMIAINGEGTLYKNGGSGYLVKDLWGIGMGAAVGIKVIQRKSIALAGYFGASKALGGIRSFRIYERAGFTIGKRFN